MLTKLCPRGFVFIWLLYARCWIRTHLTRSRVEHKAAARLDRRSGTKCHVVRHKKLKQVRDKSIFQPCPAAAPRINSGCTTIDLGSTSADWFPPYTKRNPPELLSSLVFLLFPHSVVSARLSSAPPRPDSLCTQFPTVEPNSRFLSLANEDIYGQSRGRKRLDAALLLTICFPECLLGGVNSRFVDVRREIWNRC